MAPSARGSDSEAELRERLTRAEAKADRHQKKARRSRKDAKGRKRKLEAMQTSLSWRLTAPLRLIGGPLGGRLRRRP